MHAILITLGTDGDIIPFAELGTRLRQRGHRATLVTAEHYGPLAAELGLEVITLPRWNDIDDAQSLRYFATRVDVAKTSGDVRPFAAPHSSAHLRASLRKTDFARRLALPSSLRVDAA